MEHGGVMDPCVVSTRPSWHEDILRGLAKVKAQEVAKKSYEAKNDG